MKGTNDTKLILGNFVYLRNSSYELVKTAMLSMDDLILSFNNCTEKELDSDDEFIDLFDETYKKLLPVVILTASAIEGYINAYGKFLLSSNEFKRYDKLSTVDKLCLYYRFSTGESLDRGKTVIIDLLELYKVRNNIVHEKPKVIDVFNAQSDKLNHFHIRKQVILNTGKYLSLYDRLSELITEAEGTIKCPVLDMTVSNSTEFYYKSVSRINNTCDEMQEAISELIEQLDENKD